MVSLHYIENPIGQIFSHSFVFKNQFSDKFHKETFNLQALCYLLEHVNIYLRKKLSLLDVLEW